MKVMIYNAYYGDRFNAMEAGETVEFFIFPFMKKKTIWLVDKLNRILKYDKFKVEFNV